MHTSGNSMIVDEGTSDAYHGDVSFVSPTKNMVALRFFIET